MFASNYELENIWRERVRQARLRYEQESKAFRETWGEHFQNLLGLEGSLAIQQALKRESAALKEYVRVLSAFADLVLTGKAPREHAASPENPDAAPQHRKPLIFP